MGPPSLNIDSPDYALPSLSSEGNIDSAKIGAALLGGAKPSFTEGGAWGGLILGTWLGSTANSFPATPLQELLRAL